MKSQIIYEGSEQFGPFKPMTEASQAHEKETDHKISHFYWYHRCTECRWEVSLGIVSGNPFNPDSTAVQRVTIWNAAPISSLQRIGPA